MFLGAIEEVIDERQNVSRSRDANTFGTDPSPSKFERGGQQARLGRTDAADPLKGREIEVVDRIVQQRQHATGQRTNRHSASATTQHYGKQLLIRESPSSLLRQFLARARIALNDVTV
jgi:hypothetical protein